MLHETNTSLCKYFILNLVMIEDKLANYIPLFLHQISALTSSVFLL